MLRPPTGHTWVALTDQVLPVGDVVEWAIRPDCGAVVLFTGTVRDHEEDRPVVSSLEYEAYTEQVEPRLAAVAEEARGRWPTAGRLALLHRIGLLRLGEVSVVVAAAAPHREEAFSAARFCIDTLKSTVPIWKRETWEDGQGWSEHAQAVVTVEPVSP
ncbi:MAG: molybdenum cofactor biosynthesis protein MoaE [Acidimicrobiales bacterium]